MNVQTTFPPVRTLLHPPNLPQIRFLTERSETIETLTCGNVDAEQISLRATQITSVLEEILARPGYTHGGLND